MSFTLLMPYDLQGGLSILFGNIALKAQLLKLAAALIHLSKHLLESNLFSS